MADHDDDDELPSAQRKHVRALLENAHDIVRLKAELQLAYDERHDLVTRVFDELEREPSRYRHEYQERAGAEPVTVPMTAEVVAQLRGRYEAALTPLTISGPGCDSFPACDDIEGCICVFGAGPLCCYLCASIKVIRCYF
jgi:acetylornithine deacetylase/succinyl-diaminopimelate desuccinylase-like protein